MKRLVAAVMLGSVLVTVPAWAQRTDVVYLKNGDRLTCKVKALDRGRLKVETDSMGTVYIDWTQVASLEVPRNFEVELESGEAHYGELEPGRSADTLKVRKPDREEELSIDEVVYVTEIKRGFFKRLDGSIDFGFNYQKTNNDVNYSIGAKAVYRAKRNESEISYNSILSNRNDSPRAFRNVLQGSYTHFFRNRWYVMGLAGAEQNDELGLELRTGVGAGAGRYIFQTNRQRMTWAAGLTTNREQFVTEPDPNFSIEALANLSYDFFIHGDLGTDITTSLTLFPSLTEDDRYRVEFNGKYRQEIVADLFVSLSGWYSYDSRSPVGFERPSSREDYGVVTSLGWEF